MQAAERRKAAAGHSTARGGRHGNAQARRSIGAQSRRPEQTGAREGDGPPHPWAPAGQRGEEQDPGTQLAFLPLPALSTELFLAGSLGVSGGQAGKLLPTETRHQA